MPREIIDSGANDLKKGVLFCSVADKDAQLYESIRSNVSQCHSVVVDKCCTNLTKCSLLLIFSSGTQPTDTDPTETAVKVRSRQPPPRTESVCPNAKRHVASRLPPVARSRRALEL